MIEFVVFAPLDLEIKALLGAFESEGTQDKVLPDGTCYYEVCCATTSGDDADLRIVQLKHAGVLQTAVTASRVIDLWRPACVVSFGIAGGFLGSGDVELRDVVVADSVFYYEPSKEGVGATSSERRRDGAFNRIRGARLLPLPTDDDLVVASRSAWAACRDDVDFNVRFGPIASGEKLVADLKSPTRESILALNGKMLAVEMEAAGVAAASQERSLSPFPRRFLALKGISDNASADKQLQEVHREPAAANAASFFRRLVASLPVEDDFVRLEGVRLDDIRDRARSVFEYVSPLLVNNAAISEDGVATLLHPDPPPPVFYHWTVRAPCVHWIDFRFLLVLRRLKGLGLAPRVLLSDIDSPASIAGRTHVERVIRGVLGADTPVYWFSDAERYQQRYFTYAASRGLTDSVLDRITRGSEGLNTSREDVVLKAFWVKFIGWEVRWLNRCVLLQWRKHAALTARMSKMVVLRSMILTTPDLTLGGRPGKYGAPGAEIMMDPPHFKSVLDWLETDPDPALIDEFLAHFSTADPSPRDRSTDVSPLLEGREAMLGRVAPGCSPPQSLLSLLQRLAQWRIEFCWTGQK